MPISFLESPRFPEGLSEDISLGSAWGPRWNNQMVETGSGDLTVVIAWDHPLRQGRVMSGIKREEDIYTLYSFMLAIRGNGYAFRFKDWTDYRSGAPTLRDPITAADQNIGTGDGSATTFQLRKVYTSGALQYVRPIKKPIGSTVKVAVDGVEVFSPASWSVAETTGIVTFTSPPGDGLIVSAGFEFDIPCMFVGEPGETTLRTPDANEMADLMIREVRL